MSQKVIIKAIDINAPKEIVWDVLLNDKFTRIWYAEFSEGTHAETDWRVGSKALFTDNTGSGLVGKVVVNKPNEILSVEYLGIVRNGIEDTESDESKNVKGGHETYLLSKKNGGTKLTIECDVSKDLFELMFELWDKALEKIKKLSETKE